jgi:hypothetical protein
MNLKEGARIIESMLYTEKQNMVKKKHKGSLHLSFQKGGTLHKIGIVARRPVVKQQLQDRRLYSSCC